MDNNYHAPITVDPPLAISEQDPIPTLMVGHTARHPHWRQSKHAERLNRTAALASKHMGVNPEDGEGSY